MRAYFRGNGINVLKIAPETGLKFTFNDHIKVLLLRDHSCSRRLLNSFIFPQEPFLT